MRHSKSDGLITRCRTRRVTHAVSGGKCFLGWHSPRRDSTIESSHVIREEVGRGERRNWRFEESTVADHGQSRHFSRESDVGTDRRYPKMTVAYA